MREPLPPALRRVADIAITAALHRIEKPATAVKR